MIARKSLSLIRFGLLPVVFSLLMFGITGCDSTDSGNDAGSLFDSGSIASEGGTFSYTFQEEGTFEYFCRIHDPDMQGSIVVEAGVQSSNPDTVEMIGLQFIPNRLTVAPNTEIVWMNRASTAHTVTSGNPTTGDDTNDGGY